MKRKEVRGFRQTQGSIARIFAEEIDLYLRKRSWRGRGGPLLSTLDKDLVFSGRERESSGPKKKGASRPKKRRVLVR